MTFPSQTPEARRARWANRTPEQIERERAYRRRYYQENRERFLQRQRENDDARREAKNAYNRRYGQTHRQALSKYLEQWKRDHSENMQVYRERQQSYTKRHRERHLDRVRRQNAEHQAFRRSLKRSVASELIDFYLVYLRDCGICGICLMHVSWKDFSLDHIVPLIRGGSHLYENVQASHLLCNLAKRDGGRTVRPRSYVS